jgi:hypothetical protein
MAEGSNDVGGRWAEWQNAAGSLVTRRISRNGTLGLALLLWQAVLVQMAASARTTRGRLRWIRWRMRLGTDKAVLPAGIAGLLSAIITLAAVLVVGGSGGGTAVVCHVQHRTDDDGILAAPACPSQLVGNCGGVDETAPALGSPRMHLHLLTLPLIAYRGRRETPAMLGNPTLQRRARGISREARQYASSETKSRTQQRAYSSRQETALPPMRQLDAAEIQCGRGRIVTTMRSDNGEVVEDSSCRMRFCSSAQRPRFSS